jgi:hypothetical protein
MKLYDLDILVRDTNQSNLFNFFDPTFKMEPNIGLATHTVQPEEEMRIDVICNHLYKNVDLVDILLDINDIDNPLNIMMDDVILYPALGTDVEFRLSISNTNNVRATLLNANKTTRTDNNRQKFVENNYSLPPTFKDTPEAASENSE